MAAVEKDQNSVISRINANTKLISGDIGEDPPFGHLTLNTTHYDSSAVDPSAITFLPKQKHQIHVSINILKGIIKIK